MGRRTVSENTVPCPLNRYGCCYGIRHGDMGRRSVSENCEKLLCLKSIQNNDYRDLNLIVCEGMGCLRLLNSSGQKEAFSDVPIAEKRIFKRVVCDSIRHGQLLGKPDEIKM
ncbi:hypothetical protein AVEN_23662-1 [Araneus ventricosus]|uniref:Uncharacterized protein n=1 Tax=Araneus ventricosus TaxID=182803 RepID=A0A4Y2BH89_ARAVE|nr:hypothetical protein AVEN_23662-1 [Araneus ventricosus]